MKDLDAILQGVELPSAKEISRETHRVAVTRSNREKMLNPRTRRNIQRANLRKAQDPEWRKKVRVANNNWSAERRAAYHNRDKSYLKEGSSYRVNLTKRNHLSRIPVRVRPPNGKWRTYKSIKAFADTTEHSAMIRGNPSYYFPKDMSVKTFKRENFKGWQMQRLKHAQARVRKLDD